MEASGWDSSSVPNSDQNPETHLWSELDARCEDVEVRISGPGKLSGTRDYFDEAVLQALSEGEIAGENRPSGFFASEVDEDLVAYLNEYEEAISYFGFAYYQEYSDYLYPVAIKNDDGNYVLPTFDTVGDGSYSPLGRNIYMNVLSEPSVLRKVLPFFEFGYNHQDLVGVTGYVGVTPSKAEEMLFRLRSAIPEDEEDGLGGWSIPVFSIGSVIVALSICTFLLSRRNKSVS